MSETPEYVRSLIQKIYDHFENVQATPSGLPYHLRRAMRYVITSELRTDEGRVGIMSWLAVTFSADELSPYAQGRPTINLHGELDSSLRFVPHKIAQFLDDSFNRLVRVMKELDPEKFEAVMAADRSRTPAHH